MTRSELVSRLAEQFPQLVRQDAELAVTEILNAIQDTLLGGQRVEIRGFGSFKVKDYEGYQGRNPKTGDFIDVQPKRMPFFRAGKELREFLNK